jgi:hypothetical protein
MDRIPIDRRPRALSDVERRTLRKRRYSEHDLAIPADLLEPFERVFRMYNVPTCQEST